MEIKIIVALFVIVMKIEAQLKKISETNLDKGKIDFFDRRVDRNIVRTYKNLHNLIGLNKVSSYSKKKYVMRKWITICKVIIYEICKFLFYNIFNYEL